MLFWLRWKPTIQVNLDGRNTFFLKRKNGLRICYGQWQSRGKRVHKHCAVCCSRLFSSFSIHKSWMCQQRQVKIIIKGWWLNLKCVNKIWNTAVRINNSEALQRNISGRSKIRRFDATASFLRTEKSILYDNPPLVYVGEW